MRYFLLLLLLAAGTLPASAAKRVQLQQLEQILAEAHGKPDAEVARQLSDLELTERLNISTLSRLTAEAPGPATKSVLVALVDASAFLPPPASEIPATPTPDLATQRQIMALVTTYVSKTIHQLPNFFATRTTTSFQDRPQENLQSEAGFIAYSYQPIHQVGKSSGTTLFRDGREIETKAANPKKSAAQPQGLTSWGEFGPILGTVLLDAARSKFAWSHWEQHASGLRAVFSYEVPKEKSHYIVQYCCIPSPSNPTPDILRQLAGYHGEMTIDPQSGAIVRITVQADLKQSDTISRADIMVEYGPVDIGGKTYICPIRSVSLSLARTLESLPGLRSESSVMTPPRTFLNDVAFEQYHIFRATSQVLLGDNEQPQQPSPDSPATTTADATSTATPQNDADNKPAELAANENHPAAEAAAPPASPPANPEISVTEATGLPDNPPTPPSSPSDATFSLRVNARLVDVGVVADDKKGRPVTDLKQDDFEIFDNGRKEKAVNFHHAGADAAPDATPTATPSPAPPQPTDTFTNTSTAAAKPQDDSDLLILLLDESHLPTLDLNRTRSEVLRFLAASRPTSRIALYSIGDQGFNIIQDITTDHALIIAKLTAWKPSAEAASQAQALQRHDTQLSQAVPTDQTLSDPNDDSSTASDSIKTTDLELSQMGSNPLRYALEVMTALARHFAAVPGHKSMAWLSSDSVLADWTDKAAGKSKQSVELETALQRIKESLNESHIALYPVDVSLPIVGTGGFDASLDNPNTENAPIQNGPPMAAHNSPQDQAQIQQGLQGIQGPVRQLAESTGGRAINKGRDLKVALDTIDQDSAALYDLGFDPDTPADGKFHTLVVKVPSRKNVVLRYRTGYLYSKEADTLKDRFKQAIWQPIDANQIALTVSPETASDGITLKINIAVNDLSLKQQGESLVDKLDIFMVQRDDEGSHAKITGQTMGLTLKPQTYQRLLHDGLPYYQSVDGKLDAGSLRIIVVDRNSGRMGSVTIPATALQGQS